MNLFYDWVDHVVVAGNSLRRWAIASILPAVENVYFFTSPDFNRYMDAQQAINLTIFRRFGEEGIRFALPTTNVVMREPPGARPPVDAPPEQNGDRPSGAEHAGAEQGGEASEGPGGSRQGRLQQHVS